MEKTVRFTAAFTSVTYFDARLSTPSEEPPSPSSASPDRLSEVRITPFGVEMGYAPRVEGLRAILCFLSGPLAGFVYAVAACTAGGAFLRMSGAASFVLSVFNCLPILPLDGGRVVQTLLPATQARRISQIASLVLLAGGSLVAVRFSSFAMLVMGAWLCFCNYRRIREE